MKKLVAMVMVFAALAAACGGSSGSIEDFCALEDRFDSAFDSQPASDADVDEVKDAFNELVDAAPSEIKDDVQQVADGIGVLFDAFAEAGFDPSALDDSALDDLDEDALDEAGDRIEDFVDGRCGGSS